MARDQPRHLGQELDQFEQNVATEKVEWYYLLDVGFGTKLQQRDLF